MFATLTAQQKKKGGKFTLAALLTSAVLWSAAFPSMADIVNSVVASGTVLGNPVSATATEEVDVVDQVATLAFDKVGVLNDTNNNSIADPGETITYTFTATNSGNVTLVNVILTDDKVTPSDFGLGAGDAAPLGDSTDVPTAGWAILAPGDTVTASATYTLQTADLDAGQVVNNARIDASTVPGLAVSAIDTATTPLSTSSAIALEKSGTLDLVNGVADVGDIITYQFKVTNTGPTTLTNVMVSDPMLDFAQLPNADRLQELIQLAAIPSDPIFTASFGTIQSLGPSLREPAPRRASVPQLPAAIQAERRLVRLASGEAEFKVGDRIGIYFKLTNTGEVPLTDINVLQPGSDAFGSTLEYLAPNTTDSASILFTHVLTEEDIVSGQVDFVSGISASARNRTVFSTLRGSMSLLDVDVTEDIATATITPASVPSLAPGAETFFAATYALTQADIDAGQVLNNATASATNALNAVISTADDATVPVPQAPAIALEKSGMLALGPDNEASVGDVITYNFVITNTGNTTLNDVQLTDPLPGMNVTFTEFDNFTPGEEQTFTGTYVITQTDIDAGQVQNQATASGLPSTQSSRITAPSDDPVTPAVNDPTIVELPQSPAIALIKIIDNVADTNSSGLTDVGDTVSYRFSVRNTGNVPLTNVYVQDRDSNVISNLLPPTGITLAAGEENTTTFTATYILQQADADRGYYDNTADVYGTAPDNTVVEDESDPAVYLENAPTHLEIAPQPALAVLKPQPAIVDSNSNGMNDAGDVLNYTITVTNTGNVTLSNVVVTDPVANNFTTTIPTLLPGAVNAVLVPVSYTIAAADVTAGQIENSAFAETTFGGNTVRDQSDPDDPTEDDPTITAITPNPAIALVKPQPDISDVNLNGVTDAGDLLLYTFAVTNTGNVPLDNITVTDPLGTVVSTRTTPLAAGDTDDTSFTLTYTLQAADITLGTVTNQAEVVALSPDNTPARDASDNDSILQNDPTVTTLANLISPAVALLKQAVVSDANNNLVTDAGDTITYTFTVINTGNVALTNVTVTDPTLAGEGVTLQPGNGVIGNLAVGASSSALTATRTITQADIDAGAYSNQATVAAFAGAIAISDLSHPADPASDAPTVVGFASNPALAVIKGQPTNNDANGNSVIDPGDTLTYTFSVHNTGNVTLFDIVLADNNADNLTGGPISSLAPGAVDNTTFMATRLVTDADAMVGQIVNSATAQAALVAGGVLSISDVSDAASVAGNAPTVTSIITINPALSKTAARSSIRRGERVEYTIVATALGTGPYDIADIMPPGFTFVPGSSTVNGTAAVPAVSGKTLTFANVAPTPARTITVKLSLRAATSTAMLTGEFLNRARLYLNATGQQLAQASARVTIKEEAVFDCGEIIGRVFDDLNNNGYMDDGEPGLPGVRVVTVKGLLVTTDKHGRFHVTCADVPNAQIGSNFLMKLDARTLPAGYVLTTENPRDVRLTRGKITKLNFGASKSRAVALDLTKDAFGKGLDLKPKFASGVDRLVSLVRQGRGQLTITYRCGIYAPIADERLSAVEDLVQAKWKEEGGNKPLKITTRVECGK